MIEIKHITLQALLCPYTEHKFFFNEMQSSKVSSMLPALSYTHNNSAFRC